MSKVAWLYQNDLTGEIDDLSGMNIWDAEGIPYHRCGYIAKSNEWIIFDDRF